MTRKPDDKVQNGTASAPADARGGLRLIKGGPEVMKPEAVALPQRPVGRSLISFMTAYADAIDRDVKSILDL